MTHRLREAAKTKSFNKPLAGDVGIDETFVGGKERNKDEWKRQHAGTGDTGKTAVFGMMGRGGDLRAMKVEDLTAKTIQGEVVEHVEPGSNIMSDEFASYIGCKAGSTTTLSTTASASTSVTTSATSTGWKAHGRTSSGRCSAFTTL